MGHAHFVRHEMGMNMGCARGHNPLCVLDLVRFIAPTRALEWVFGTLVFTLLVCDVDLA